MQQGSHTKLALSSQHVCHLPAFPHQTLLNAHGSLVLHVAASRLKRPGQGGLTTPITLLGPAARMHCAKGPEPTIVCPDAAGAVLGIDPGHTNCLAAANTFAQVPCDPSANGLGGELVEMCSVLCRAASLE